VDALSTSKSQIPLDKTAKLWDIPAPISSGTGRQIASVAVERERAIKED